METIEAVTPDIIEVTSKRYVCRHIHTTGNRCGSPALKGEEFCYYHHATRRGPRPADHDYLCPNSTFDLPSLEDRPSIQLAVAVVARRIALNQIDLQRARLLLYAIRIASINLPREPHTAEPAEVTQVEEIQHDPIHGPLAPVAEVVPEAEYKGWAQRLIEELHEQARASHEANAISNAVSNAEPSEAESEAAPIEAIIPELQAVAHTSHLKAHSRAHKQSKLTADSRPLKAVSKNTRLSHRKPTPGVLRLEKDKKPCCSQTSSRSFTTLRMTARNLKERGPN